MILFVVLIITTAVVCRGVEVSLSVAGVILGLEMLVLIVLIVLIMAVVARDGVPVAAIDALAPSEVLAPGLGIAFLFAVAAFAGFEATVVFSEEARDAHRTVPRAVIISISIIAVTYALSTFALSIAWGPDNAQAAARSDPITFLLGPAAAVVGDWLALTMEILIVTSFIASLVGSMNMFARLVFSLGRAGVLPGWLGSTARRNGTPARALIAIAGVVGVILAGFTLAGADLILVTFGWLLALGTVALLMTLIVTSLAILVFFVRHREVRPGWWSGFIAPLVSLIGFVIVGVLAVTNYDTLLGGQGGTAEWLLVVLPVAAIVGVVVSGAARRSPNFPPISAESKVELMEKSMGSRDVALIGLPYQFGRRDDGGGYRMARGPEVLLARNAVPARLAHSGVPSTLRWLDDLDDAPTAGPGGFPLSPGDQMVRQLVQNRGLGSAVRAAKEAGDLPLISAGGCNSSLGVISGLDDPGVGLIWFDAHADAETPETSRDGLFEGMPVSIIAGRCWA